MYKSKNDPFAPMNSWTQRLHLFDLEFFLTTGISLLIHVWISTVRMLRDSGNFGHFLSFSGFGWQSWWRRIQTHVRFWSTMLGNRCSNCSSFQALLNSISRGFADSNYITSPGVLRAEAGVLVAGRGGRWGWPSTLKGRTGAPCPCMLLWRGINILFSNPGRVKRLQWRLGLVGNIAWRRLCEKKKGELWYRSNLNIRDKYVNAFQTWC